MPDDKIEPAKVQVVEEEKKPATKLDPRQTQFLSSYLDPKSKTFGNAYQSAIKVGYGEEYARNLTGQMPNWLSENIRQTDLLKKAERNLKEFLDMDVTITKFSKKGLKIVFADSKLKAIKADITKFVAERAGKQKWSKKVFIEDETPNDHVLDALKAFNEANDVDKPKK